MPNICDFDIFMREKIYELKKFKRKHSIILIYINPTLYMY